MAGRLYAMLGEAGKEYLADGGMRLSAALSYYTLFSLVPLLFLAVAIAGYVFGDPDAVREAVDQVTDVAGAEVGSSLEDLLEVVQAQRGRALSIGIVLSAFTAAGIFQQVQAVLGIVFHVPKEKKRTGPVGWLIRRLIGIASAIVLAVLVLAPIGAVAGIDWLVSLLPGSTAAIAPALRFAIPALSLAMLMLLTGLTFQALTAVEIPWQAALRGGAITALIGVTAAFLVGAYLSSAATTGTLGALGGAAILLFFFNLMWTVYVFGAEVTKVYADYLRHGNVRQAKSTDPRAKGEPGRIASPEPPTSPIRPKLLAAAVVGFLLGRSFQRR